MLPTTMPEDITPLVSHSIFLMGTFIGDVIAAKKGVVFYCKKCIKYKCVTGGHIKPKLRTLICERSLIRIIIALKPFFLIFETS